MKKTMLALAVFIMSAGAALAQDWVQTDDGGAEYNCTLLATIWSEYGGHAIARVDQDLYSIADLFDGIVSDCALEAEPAPANPDHQPEWVKSAMHKTEYDCALLKPILSTYGDELLVRTVTDVFFTLSEFFASLAPDCVADVDISELTDRIRVSEGWVTGANQDYEFNCDFVSAAIAEFGHLALYRDDARTLSVAEFFQLAVPRCQARADLSRKGDIAAPSADWMAAGSGETNCPTVKLLLVHYGAPDFLRSGTKVWTLFSYYQPHRGCLPYALLAPEATALRDCPEIACEIVARLARDTALTITGLRENWYQVEYKQQDRFVPVSADTPVASVLVEPRDGVDIDEIDCFLSPVSRVDGPMAVEIIDLSSGTPRAEITLFEPPQPLGIYIVRFVRGEQTRFVAVPLTYETSFEFLVSCE